VSLQPEQVCAPARPPLAEEEADSAIFHSCPISPDCPACGGSTSFDWSFVDAVYCISLQERQDRATDIAIQFHKAGLCRRVQFYRPRRHPKNSTEGIWESHRVVAKHALAAGHKSVLIFEDDAVFRPALSPRKLDRIRAAFLAVPPDWTIFYLGHWPLKIQFLGRNLVRTRSACTHAYIASRSLMEWLVSTPYAGAATASGMIGKGLDSAYTLLAGTYAFFPMVAVQSASPSDHISRGKHKKIRNLRHLVVRTKLHDYLLSYLMRPAELFAAALSPFQEWDERPK